MPAFLQIVAYHMPYPAKLSPADTAVLIHFSVSLVSTLWFVAAETAPLQPQELIKCFVTLDIRGSAVFVWTSQNWQDLLPYFLVFATLFL